MWKLTYYATVEICALKITCNEPWFRDTEEYFRGWPHQELRWVIHMLWISAVRDDSCLLVMHNWSIVDVRNAFYGLGYQVFSRGFHISVTSKRATSGVLVSLIDANCFYFRFPVTVFYMCECGFYIYSIAALLMWETRRKDFAVMMSHHVITVILIGYSYITR